MPSSADRKRLEVPTYLHERLVEIAIDEDRTVASVVQEVIAVGLEHYASRRQPGSDRLTERARRALAYAEEEAVLFNHRYVGTEHLLLGLLREEEGVAARILGRLGVTLEQARDFIAYHYGRGTGPATTSRPMTLRTRNALRLAEELAERFDTPFVGTEHLLLALTQIGDGAAAKMLAGFGVLQQARAESVALILDAADRPSTQLPGADRSGPDEPR